MTYQTLLKYYLRESNEEDPEKLKDQYSYDMKYVNGGFANSVDVQPGTNEDSGKVNVSINIFGRGEKKQITLPTPPKIQQMLKAYEVSLKKQDPSADRIKVQLEKYYADLKISIAEKFINVMKEMDAKSKQVLIQSIKETNGKYQ
jgi:hypothetical protein